MASDIGFEEGASCQIGHGRATSAAASREHTVDCPDCGRPLSVSREGLARHEYRLGYAGYVEARRQLTVGLEQYERGRFTDARAHVEAAADGFGTAVGQFTTAVGVVEREELSEHCERARQKATCLWQAMEWLSGATFASERGADELAERFQERACGRLRTAADYGNVADPGDLTGRDDPSSDGSRDLTSR